ARTQGRGHHVAKQLARCAAHDEKPPRLQPAMIRSPRAGAQKYLPLRIGRSWIRQSRDADPRVDGFKNVHRIPRSSDWLFLAPAAKPSSTNKTTPSRASRRKPQPVGRRQHGPPKVELLSACRAP